MDSKHYAEKLGIRGSSLLPAILSRMKEPNDNESSKGYDS
jgi:hypothetical protein